MRIRNRRRQRGVAALEFALLAPVLFVILVGVFEFGTAFWQRQMLASALREGARVGVVATNPRKNDAEIKSTINAFLSSSGFSTQPTVTVVPLEEDRKPGTFLRVSAVWPASFVVLSKFPLAGGLKPSIDLTATVSMRME